MNILEIKIVWSQFQMQIQLQLVPQTSHAPKDAQTLIYQILVKLMPHQVKCMIDQASRGEKVVSNHMNIQTLFVVFQISCRLLFC